MTDHNHLVSRCSQDPMFSFMYPICELAGEDVEQVIVDIRKTAKVSLNDPMTIAVAYRQRLAEKHAGIRRISD